MPKILQQVRSLNQKLQLHNTLFFLKEIRVYEMLLSSLNRIGITTMISIHI